jgi:hypothetical protein
MKQGVGQKVDVKMNDVEFIGAAPDLPQHGERAADMIANAG